MIEMASLQRSLLVAMCIPLSSTFAHEKNRLAGLVLSRRRTRVRLRLYPLLIYE